MFQNDDVPDTNKDDPSRLGQSITAAQAFIELFTVFLRSKDRPSIPRMLVNSILLMLSFALSIIVLFGLPLALIVLARYSEDPTQSFSLAKIGLKNVELSSPFVIFGYLAIYAISVCCSYAGRWMLVTDNTRYISALTDSMGTAFDASIKRNLHIPNLKIDKALYNRISLSGTRILPRLHIALLSGIMPAIYASISLSMLLFVDFWVGIGVLLLVAITVPFILRSANKSINLTQEHMEDLKAFNQSYRDYTGEVIFASELEWSKHNEGSLYERLTPDKSKSLKETRDNFFSSLRKRQTATDETRFIVGVASVTILGIAFLYYLHAPWAEIKIGTIIFLVLGFRYFFVALNGLSSSFVAISTSYNYLHEILDFLQAFETAQKQSNTVMLSQNLSFSRPSGETVLFTPYDNDLIEVIIDSESLTYSNILKAYTRILQVDGPRFLDNVTAIGFPGRNYQRIQDLFDWINTHPKEVLTGFSLPQDSDISTPTKLKKLFETTYFPSRGLVLPNDLWHMLLEWIVHHNTPHSSKSKPTLILNGALLARLPSAARKVIVNEEPNTPVFVLYITKPNTFISDKALDVLVVNENKIWALPKTAFEDNWLENFKAKISLNETTTKI